MYANCASSFVLCEHKGGFEGLPDVGCVVWRGGIEEEVDRKFCLFIVQEFELFLRYAGSLWPTIKISIASCNSMDGPRRTTDEDG